MFYQKPPGFAGAKPIVTPGSGLDLITGLGQAFNRPANGLIADQNDPLGDGWLSSWDIQPSQNARYLPDYPLQDDISTGADIRRGWHDTYKNYAYDKIGQHTPVFAEQMPKPRPQQSYGEFLGEVQNTAHTMVNKAAGMLGQGFGQALGFIPGMGAVMELVGNAANIAGSSGLGGEKGGALLGLAGSFANGAAHSGGLGKGEPKQPPAPQPQTAPPTSTQEEFFKPYDQMLQEIEERQARGEIFDENNNWVKPMSNQELQTQESDFSINNQPSWLRNDKSMQEAAKNVFGDGPPLTDSKYQPSPYDEKRLNDYLDKLHDLEGGYNDTKGDRGGPTKYGISTESYRDLQLNPKYQGKEWPKNVYDLSREQANHIYRNEYYYNFNLHKIDSDPVREFMTDMAVNNGYDNGTQILKDSLNQVIGTKDYGPGKPVVGPKMRAGIEEAEKQGKIPELMNAMINNRIDFVTKGVSNGKIDPIFLKGLISRYNQFRPSRDLPKNWIKGDPNL